MQEEWFEVLDPTGEAQPVEFEAAPRIGELAGKPIGYLDNNKWNAEPLLRAIHEHLRNRYEAGEMVYARKRSFSQPAPAEIYEHIEREAAAAVIAIGD